MDAALSGTLATMGPALPYALAAKFAHPDRPVVAVMGDGAFQMIGVNALIDIARYHDRWANRQLVVCVLHNDDLNQVTWEQRVMSGEARLEASQTLPNFPYARYAELLGLTGVRVDDPSHVAADSPLWTLPNVIVSPRTAALSARENERIVFFSENLRRWLRGEALLSRVDPERAY